MVVLVCLFGQIFFFFFFTFLILLYERERKRALGCLYSYYSHRNIFLGFISFLNPSEGFDSPTPSNLIVVIAVSGPKRILHRSLQIWLAETQEKGKSNSDLSVIDGSIIYGADPFSTGLWPSSCQGYQRSPASSEGWKSDDQNVVLLPCVCVQKGPRLLVIVYKISIGLKNVSGQSSKNLGRRKLESIKPEVRTVRIQTGAGVQYLGRLLFFL